MNILEAEVVSSPTGLDENTAKFTIDDPLSPFTLHTITEIGKEYTLSFYSKRGDSIDHKILVAGKSFDVTSKWEKHVATFTAKAKQVDMYFQSNGVYYVYHSKLESGNRAMDWTVAPEDTEETLNDLNNAVSNLKLSITKESLIATIGTHYVTDEAFGKYKSEVSLALTKDSIIATVGDYYVTPDGLSGMQSQITQNADSITTLVKKDNDLQSQITQNADSITSLVTADSNLQTQITQTAQSISTKVEKNGIISAINQTAESVKISASKITLAGATIADSFTATNLTITGNSVFKGKLEGATGDFSGKITASSGQIAGFTIQDSKLSSNFFTISSNEGFSYQQLDSKINMNYLGIYISRLTTSYDYSVLFGLRNIYWRLSSGYLVYMPSIQLHYAKTESTSVTGVDTSTRTIALETGVATSTISDVKPVLVWHGDLYVRGQIYAKNNSIILNTAEPGVPMFKIST